MQLVSIPYGNQNVFQVKEDDWMAQLSQGFNSLRVSECISSKYYEITGYVYSHPKFQFPKGIRLYFKQIEVFPLILFCISKFQFPTGIRLYFKGFTEEQIETAYLEFQFPTGIRMYFKWSAQRGLRRGDGVAVSIPCGYQNVFQAQRVIYADRTEFTPFQFPTGIRKYFK